MGCPSFSLMIISIEREGRGLKDDDKYKNFLRYKSVAWSQKMMVSILRGKKEVMIETIMSENDGRPLKQRSSSKFNAHK